MELHILLLDEVFVKEDYLGRKIVRKSIEKYWNTVGLTKQKTLLFLVQFLY